MEITEHKDMKEITLLFKPKQLQELQKNDIYCRDIAKKLHKDQELQKIFIEEKGVLYRLLIEDGHIYKSRLYLSSSSVTGFHDNSFTWL